MNRIHYIYNIALLLLMGAATPTFAQTIKGNVYGGGNLSQVVGSTTIDIKSGGISEKTAADGNGNIYGGGYGASAVLTGNTTINVTGGTITKDVYGGGALANVTGSTEVNIAGGTVTQDVYGGGALANVSENTSVNLIGGTIRDSYGGGLGSNEVAALIGGNATTTLNGSVVNGSVFGCNNLNGTPQGHAKVHVFKTTPRDGQTSGQYDVAAVYGGGNLAAYEPTNVNEFAEVLIENCDNSIEYVYGGGNAAPVPATQVTIYGANAIDNAFAGGNGAGQSTDPSAPNYNPGADIGYKGFFSSGNATEYGTGIATINVQGGTIHHVYGGSNTLGYIRDHAEVNVNDAGTCTMDVAELYGGGKMAPGKAAQINITCTGEGKIDNVYGGAHMADLTGDITLNINGGNIGNAFGGNNVSGNINGAITVNVNWDAEACVTNSLNNVFGAGNLAQYSVYGYDTNRNPITEGTPKYAIAVNIKNGTVTNNVYGGGKGDSADHTKGQVYGSPLVTIGDTSKPGSVATVGGDVYGGGDAGNVVGTPQVRVPAKENTTIANVYGGGNAADVNGTDLLIDGGHITGMVFGGGHGSKDDPATPETEPTVAANVKGDVQLYVTGGTINKVFAGSNANGNITGDVDFQIAKGNTSNEMHINEVYGGGNEAAGNAGTILIGCTGSDSEGIGDVYGGANAADINSDITLTITGGRINNVFGGNNTSGDIKGDIEVNIEWNGDCTNSRIGNVYGGGNLATYGTAETPRGPVVNIKNGTISENVYGGGKGDPADHTKGQITGNPIVNIGNTTDAPDPDTWVAHVVGDVYGGGDAGNVVGTPQVNIINKCNTIIDHDVYGGGNAADVSSTDVNIDGGTITGMVFGGGHGDLTTEPQKEANVGGDVHVDITGGTIGKVFGGSNSKGTITGKIYLNINKEDGHCDMHINEVYGGGNEAAGNAGTILIGCTGSDSEGIGDVYGGANAADINSDITLTITGGRINNVFGGNNTSGDIKGNIEVNIAWDGSCDNSKIDNVYGGGNLATYGTAETPRGPVVNIKNGTISENVYGGGKGDPADHTKGQITGNPIVNIGNTTDAPDPDTWVAHVVGDVYGGGDAGNVVGTPQVNIINKCNTIIDQDVYGGGNAADVSSTDVNIDGGTITGMVFGGGHGNKDAVDGEGNPAPTEANVEGDVHVDITGGSIGKVFGGSNSKGSISGDLYLNINKEDDHCDMHIGEVYGGGNFAEGNAGTITIGCTGDFDNNGEGIGDVYGGANQANINSPITLTITGGHINRVFGGNNASGNIAGPITVNVDWDDELTCGKYLGDVFGGGNLANYANATTVNMKKGTVNHIYGGGNEAGVGSATVNMLGGDVLQGLYGGCNTSGTVTSDIAVNVTNGTIGTDADLEANVHGGGYGSDTRTNGNVTVTIAEAAEKNVTIWGDVYGGSALGNVNDASSDLTKVQLDKGTVNGNIYGGGLGDASNAALVNGQVQVIVNGGTVTEKIFGCNNLNGTPKADVTVTINGSDAPATPGTFALSEVYGGGNMADYSPDGGAVCKVVVNNCDTSIGTVYGGGNAADVTSTDVEINGGQIGTVFGGGHGDKDAEPQTEANVSGNVNVKIYGGTIDKVFAGSNSKGTINGKATLTVNKQGTCDMKINEVYGGGNEAAGNAGTVNIACTGDEANGEGIKDVYGGARMADVTSPITLNITGGNINRVFGGNNISGSISGAIEVNIEEDDTNCGMNLNTVYGAGNKANYTGSPVVNIKKGTVKQDVFGGGLQATVTGNTTVNVTGGQVVRDLYGGGALANVEGSTAVNLTGGTVCNAYGGGLGSISGQDGATETVAALVTGNTLVTLNGSIVTGQIFGCNNVNGTPQGHAKVLVQKTVAQPDAAVDAYHVAAVYGGGNKAGYYPTSDAEYAEVEVRNCETSIETVYGGGNAAPVPATEVNIWGGTINEVFAGGNGKGAGNPGADVGFKEDHTTLYGAGTTFANIYSGVIVGVFGGSNTKGNIRVSSNVHLDDKTAETGCTFSVGEIYGAGNEAFMVGDSRIDLGCVPRLEVLYGGAKNADMGGNIELNITSGAFGKVFGGNNMGGKIKGSITVNIDETGCYPVEIDELYACGNKAAYSVFGYDIDGNMLTSGTKVYNDPTVNVISCTKIGTVFGGGLGEEAVVYGDPVVNINQIKGKFAGQTHPLKTGESIVDGLGAIGRVFGGGNEAKVVGNTNVNVGTIAQNKHLDADDSTKVDAGANITGNVYGGGNAADVTGKTNVTIGRDN